MEKEIAITTMQNWYSRKYLLYEIFFSGMQDRETAVLVPKTFMNTVELRGIRYLRIAGTDGLRYMLERMACYKSQNTPMNVYYSLAKYKEGLPVMSPVLHFRKKDIEQWRDKMNSMIVSYDCLIDIDSPDHAHMGYAKETAGDITRLLNKFKVPYYLRFSGMGYHIVIPYDAFYHLDIHMNPEEDVDRSVYTLFNTITDRLNDKFSEMVDTGLHDSRRILKVPYTLSMYADGCFVCWPFNSRSEFLEKSWKDFLVDRRGNFAGEEKIFRRGQKLFNPNWDREGVNGFLRFLGVPFKEVENGITAENSGG